VIEQRIDLHTHSTASDGTFSPRALVRAAAAAGLAALALTDHDTGNGLAEAEDEAKRLNVKFIPGIEISGEWPEPGLLHILGYYIDRASPALGEMSRILLAARDLRNPKIIHRLTELGCKITLEQVEAIARRGVAADQPVVLGRPHIAQAMVEAGSVASVKQAFDVYLGTGGAAYFAKERLTPRQAIHCIHEAGGVAVVAHPIELGATNPAHLQTMINHLQEAGLDGLEVWHCEQDAKYSEMLLHLAKRYDLVATGGSDFHGRNKPDVMLGRGKGNVSVPAEVLERLEARWQQRRSARVHA